MFFQFLFMGWKNRKNDFTPLAFFFTVFSTSEENDEVMISSLFSSLKTLNSGYH